jgi:hypothetical protein
MTLRTISPFEAQEMLGNGRKPNRRVNLSRVRRYARDMETGKWVVNGESIKIDEEGDVEDGQHRLLACVESGVSFQTYVIEGIPREHIHTIDQGQPRTLRGSLAIDGVEYTNLLPTFIRLTWLWERGLPLASPEGPSISEGREVLDRHPGMADAARWADQINRSPIGRAAILGGLIYIFSRIDAPAARAFYEGLLTGANLPPGNPVLLLRDRILASKNTRQDALTSRELTALTIKAWNHFRAGNTIKLLKWATRGKNKESFPQIEAA